MNFREITAEDIPELFAVRAATHENRLTLEQLTALGISEASVSEKLAESFNGWSCEAQGKVVGFATGDEATGESWVIAVLPEYIGKRIGSTLLTTVEN